MTVVLEAKTIDGVFVGRCDAKCYRATGSKCKCICGGKNHGVGISQAFKNLQGLERDKPSDIVYVTRPHQRKLFTRELAIKV